MPALTLSAAQADLAALPSDRRIFLEGVAGTGKTTAGVARLLRLLAEGVPADSILVLTPQRTLAAPFTDALRGPAAPAGGEVTVLTLGGLAQRMVELFWPIVAAEAGFAQPDRPPTFLTLETAQYFMARLVGPLLAEGYFDSISIDRNRLYSQILDNLNKAAAVGFPHSEIGARLTAAWVGDSVQTRVYAEAQECADRFRAYCLAHNLLDFSLQYELFAQRLWPLPACRDYLTRRYTHLIVDNVEEDTPVAHDLLAAWLPTCASALVIYDWEAGYRRFLGADSRGAYRLKTLCNEHVTFTDSFVTSPEVHALEGRLARALGAKRSAEPVAVVMGRGRARIDASEMSFDAQPAEPAAPALPPDAAGVRPALDFTSHRYHPEMLDWVADEIAGLVHGRGLPPKQIAVLAPFLGSGLRFALDNRLTARDVPVRSHRPSRSLREEPVTACLLTLAVLAHPAWGAPPSKFDVAYALTQAIDEMDLVRAQLLTEVVYRVRDGAPILGSFADIEPAMQERITFLLGGRYEGLRAWLGAQMNERGSPTGRGHASRTCTRGHRIRRSSFVRSRPFPRPAVRRAAVAAGLRLPRQLLRGRSHGECHRVGAQVPPGDGAGRGRPQAAERGAEAIARPGIHRAGPGRRRGGAVRAQLAAAADRRRAPGAGLHLSDDQSAGGASVLARRGEQRLVGTAQPTADAALRFEPHLAGRRAVDRSRRIRRPPGGALLPGAGPGPPLPHADPPGAERAGRAGHRAARAAAAGDPARIA